MNPHNRTALILIDLQKGFDELEYWGGERNNLNAEENAAGLLSFWREKGFPVFHVMHCSTNPLSPLNEKRPGNEFKVITRPLKSEAVIRKSVNSAFIGTDLKERLNDARIHQLVIAGLTTDHCISTTTRMAGNFGFDTYVVSDATATFNKTGINGEIYPAELIHLTALASLNMEFATVVTTDFLKSRVKDLK